MRLKFAALSPVISLVVMVHVAKQQTTLRLVDDDSNVTAYPDGPEILVFCFIEFVETIAGIGRVDLEIEDRGFDGFLFLARQSGKTVCKGFPNAKVHWLAAH